MKKTTLASICFDVLAFILFAVVIIYSAVKEERVEKEYILTISALVSIALLFVFKLLFDKKNTIAMIVPVALSTAMLLIYNGWANDLAMQVANNNIELQVVNINVSVLFNAQVLSLVLIAVFAVSTVLALLKKYKWASIVTITYLALLFIYSVTSFINMSTFFNDRMSYMFEFGAVMSLNVALIVYFLAGLVKCNCTCNKEDEIDLNLEEDKVEDSNTKEETKETE